MLKKEEKVMGYNKNLKIKMTVMATKVDNHPPEHALLSSQECF
jgi:hypothetical protein